MLLISLSYLWGLLALLLIALGFAINYILVLRKRDASIKLRGKSDGKTVTHQLPEMTPENRALLSYVFSDGRHDFDAFPDGTLLYVRFLDRPYGTMLVKAELSDKDYASLKHASIVQYDRSNQLHFSDMQRSWSKIAVRARADSNYLVENLGDPTLEAIRAEVATFPPEILESMMNQVFLGVPVDKRVNLKTELWRSFFETPPVTQGKSKTAIIETNSLED
jgi:hypothetical protein